MRQWRERNARGLKRLVRTLRDKLAAR